MHIVHICDVHDLYVPEYCKDHSMYSIFSSFIIYNNIEAFPLEVCHLTMFLFSINKTNKKTKQNKTNFPKILLTHFVVQCISSCFTL